MKTIDKQNNIKWSSIHASVLYRKNSHVLQMLQLRYVTRYDPF